MKICILHVGKGKQRVEDEGQSQDSFRTISRRIVGLNSYTALEYVYIITVV